MRSDCAHTIASAWQMATDSISIVIVIQPDHRSDGFIRPCLERPFAGDTEAGIIAPAAKIESDGLQRRP